MDIREGREAEKHAREVMRDDLRSSQHRGDGSRWVKRLKTIGQGGAGLGDLGWRWKNLGDRCLLGPPAEHLIFFFHLILVCKLTALQFH